MKGTLTRLSGELRRMPRVCVKEAGDASLLATMRYGSFRPADGTGIDEP